MQVYRNITLTRQYWHGTADSYDPACHLSSSSSTSTITLLFQVLQLTCKQAIHKLKIYLMVLIPHLLLRLLQHNH